MNEQDSVQRDVAIANTSNKTVSTKHEVLSNGTNVLNLFDEKQLAAAEIFLKKIIASDKSGIKSVNEGLAIMMRAQDLQLPFSSCIEHIHVINGKTGIDIHIIKSLLSRAGITWDCTKDYIPQYNYTDGNTIYLETLLPTYCLKCRTAKEAEEKTTDDVVGVYPVRWYADLKGNIYNEFEISDKCVIATNRIHASKIAANGQFPILRIAAQPIDYMTEYKFTRYKIINGKEREMTSIGHYSYNEAQTAGLLTKDTYKGYARIMIGIRAFTYGARDIASDVLMGCYETTELKVLNNEPLNADDFVEAIEVN